MLCPTQPTLETYITKGANLTYDNGVTAYFSYYTPSPFPPKPSYVPTTPPTLNQTGLWD